ncbi:TraY domain-containing protein (plasmid) [Vibrio alfacsensis]|uniref:TraY domain-containing protein n=1 Tax=Vibrio alfacsensis TaxID=1074311 RepID=UPI002ADE507B|nr:TraY domain-containing protein [Vibrio alfacsensis]WQE79457.1 TraY domain-containing protein [Vibrio alfacsensis]
MTKSSKKTTAIWFEMDKETNRLLNLFSELNGRSKRSEAAHRLKLSLENEYKKQTEAKR